MPRTEASVLGVFLFSSALGLAACAYDAPAVDGIEGAIGRGGEGPPPDAAPPSTPAPHAPDAAANGDGDGLDRDVLRPASRAPTDALIASLRLPEGFSIGVYARDLKHARMLGVHGTHVYLTRPNQGDVLRLIDADGDGVAEQRVTVASGLEGVHGITFHETQVFLATPTHVYRADVDPAGNFGAPTAIIDDLPAGGQHPNRTLAIGPDQKLYVSVGSSCDACRETDPEHATLLRATRDGATRAVFARGLRNTLGFGWHPETGALWGMDHGSDWRGDDLPPEELNHIEAGRDYGWPYCFGDKQIDFVIQDPPDMSKQAYCAKTTAPVRTNQAHDAPIGLAFYTADQFPAAYRNSAFVAFRGSWNRDPATGYKVGRVVFQQGEPVAIEDFVTGFLIEDGKAQFGRLAGIAVAPDGSLLFTDDENGVVYRVHHAK
ncbi:MAG: PQQ-dependent sugar dehydrogenase [Polyangiales bacterium]